MQTLELMTQALIVAQASGEMADWIAPVVIVVVILIVAALAVASRKNVEADASSDDTPKPTQVKDIDPKIKQYTTNVDEIREQGFDEAEIEAILAKPRDQRTMAEVRKLNLAKKASKTLKERITAVEQTQLARQEHDEFDAHGEVETPTEDDTSSSESTEAEVESKSGDVAEQKEDDAKSFEDGLGKTRDGFSKEFFGLFKGKEQLDEDLRDAIEEFLYTSDIGAKAATKIMAQIDRTKDEVKRDPTRVWEFVRRYITEEMLAAREDKLDIGKHAPFVMLIVGVNGAGKTTTIGKLASRYKRQGKKVLVVAGDTFRAAAVEQLEVWTERVNVPIHKGKTEADPASVVFDGIARGVEEDFDVILCDTSGRLHTDIRLMDELKKIERVSGKALEGAPHETVLVLDANSGQNAVAQARTFGEALGISGLILTKLDGTARGGVIMGIGEELDVPVRYVGIGEGIKDLREFDAREFADALFL